MKQTENKSSELISLNTKFTEFDLQKLENRLETDPLFIGGVLDLNSSDTELFQLCYQYHDCNIYSCGEMICYGYSL